MEKQKDFLSEILTEIDFSLEFAVGLGEIKNPDKFEKIIRRYDSFEKIILSPRDLMIGRYLCSHHPFEDLINMSTLVGIKNSKYAVNILINVSRSRDLSFNGLEEYVEKTGVKLVKIENIKCSSRQLSICRNEMMQALIFYIGSVQYGPFYINIYNKEMSEAINKRK